MTAYVELLPLPNVWKYDGFGKISAQFTADHMRTYARANVAHATAAKDAEIEALRAEVAKMRGKWADAESNLAACDSDLHVFQQRAERLAEALRKLSADLRTLAGGETPDGDGVPVNVILWAEKRLAAIDQERKDG